MKLTGYNLVCAILIMGLVTPTMAQHSFEIIPGPGAFYYAFEDSDKNYIGTGATFDNDTAALSYPFIAKFDSYGNEIIQKSIYRADTFGYFKYGMQKANGNYLLVGNLGQRINLVKTTIIYLCEVDEDLNIIRETTFALPAPFKRHTLNNFLITPDQNLLVQGIADSSLYSSNALIFITKFDLEGNLLHYHLYDNWRANEPDLIYDNDSTEFVLFGRLSINSVLKDYVKMDNDLNLKDYGTIPDSLSHFLEPVSGVRLPNNNLLLANQSYSEEIPSDGDLEVRLYNGDLSLVKDTLLIFDEDVYLTAWKGVDYVNPNLIYVNCFDNTWWNQSGSEYFYVHIFDQEMNLRGSKKYGGYTRFWLLNTRATLDGGCLISGFSREPLTRYIAHAYLIKVMPEDILTATQELTQSDKNIKVFPNPFAETLTIISNDENIFFTLSDSFGRQILIQTINRDVRKTINTAGLHAGVYFYQFCDEKGTCESGKIIKL